MNMSLPRSSQFKKGPWCDEGWMFDAPVCVNLRPAREAPVCVNLFLLGFTTRLTQELE